MPHDRRPLPAEHVIELARIAGFPLADSDEAARIASGAAAACAALQGFSSWDLGDAESTDFLQEQAALAPSPEVSPGSPRPLPAATINGEAVTALSLCDIADRIARGDVSSVAVTEACLQRAEREQTRLNCFLQIDSESALQAARAADRALAQGAKPGVLHGVPLAHKAMFDVAGQVNLRGAKIHSPPASKDASTIARLRAAGALSLGQLNMSEFAFGPTGNNQHFGRCRNAVDPDYMAGGSSSGSAAATAAEICFGSLGSDTGGSVRIPAAANGVVGLKPTYGLVPRRGR